MSAKNKSGQQSFWISKWKSSKFSHQSELETKLSPRIPFPIHGQINENFHRTRQGKEKRRGDAAGVFGYLAAGFEFTDISEHARCESRFIYDDDDDDEDEDDARVLFARKT